MKESEEEGEGGQKYTAKKSLTIYSLDKRESVNWIQYILFSKSQ